MTAEILVVAAIPPFTAEPLEKAFTCHYLTKAPDKAKMLAEIGSRIRGVMTSGGVGINGETIGKLPKLEIVSVFGVGYDPVDVPACKARGIRVTNTPGVLDDTTADLTWALLMAAARRIAEGDAQVRRGDWKLAFAMQSPLGADVHHATLGIIGMGRIGQAIAKRATGFDMRVLYHNRGRIPDADERRLNATWVERDRLFAESDFVVVMVPYSPAVHHLIGAAEIAKMKPTAILVNTARGGVVDDAALVEALKAGRIAGAGLDVFEGEPKLNPGYLSLPNAVLTPHIGSATRATRMRMCETAVANLTAALEGRAPPDLVNKELAQGARQ